MRAGKPFLDFVPVRNDIPSNTCDPPGIQISFLQMTGFVTNTTAVLTLSALIAPPSAPLGTAYGSGVGYAMVGMQFETAPWGHIMQCPLIRRSMRAGCQENVSGNGGKEQEIRPRAHLSDVKLLRGIISGQFPSVS